MYTNIVIISANIAENITNNTLNRGVFVLFVWVGQETKTIPSSELKRQKPSQFTHFVNWEVTNSS
jgi:hypothetical protein